MKFRCLFVAIFTELLVLSGFVYSMIIYREIFQIPYYQTWNTLIMFIVISTSTNNIFFFYDQWNASGGISKISESREQRLFFASGRTLRVNAAASFLICSIYYSMYFSPLVAIKSLVVWAATVILINSITQFLFFPCILLVYEKHVIDSWFDRKCSEFKEEFGRCLESITGGNDADNKRTYKTWVSDFFFNGWNDFVREYRWAIIGITLAWFVISNANIANLGAAFFNTVYMRDGDQISRARTSLERNFSPMRNQSFETNFVFGIRDMTLKENSMWESKFTGTVNFDSSFDGLKTAPSQNFMLEFC